MAYNFMPFKKRLEEIEDWLRKEFLAVRTGKASPLLLDAVMVESYGTKVPIKHIATIMTEDAKTLRVTPWDRGQIKAIEGAIAAANLGISTAPDSDSVRVIFPDLSAERREALKKVIKEKLEEARISTRKEREIALSAISEQEKNKEISEDDKFRFKEELQKMIDESSVRLEEIAAKKTEEVSH